MNFFLMRNITGVGGLGVSSGLVFGVLGLSYKKHILISFPHRVNLEERK